MSSWFEAYKDEITKELENEVLKVALERFSRTYWNARNNALRRLPYYNYYRKRVREIKAWSIEHLDELIKMTKENIESLGGSFYLASNATDAVEYVSKVCEGCNAKLVVKSKSMVTEELSLNEALIKKGIEVVETDLGEWIIQLRSEKPSHIIYPAIHLTTEEIARTFSKALNMEVPPDASKLVRIARERLRQKFINADVGISGANVIAADTGTVLVIENEGNARFSTNAPPIHICVSGIEKIVPTVEDAILTSRVITPNATGQLMPVYISLITGPSRTADIELKLTLGVHGPKEYYMVLVDNGRSKMMRDPDFKEASYCIRCGACLSDCPIYREIGGIVWSHKYMGGIGAIWTSFTHGLEKATPIALTCTACGRCKAICPMEIDTPTMILKLRQKLLKAGLMPQQLISIAENIKTAGNPFGILR
ncbi:MAG: lactate utilization protein B [Sulfolobales archaeon]